MPFFDKYELFYSLGWRQSSQILSDLKQKLSKITNLQPTCNFGYQMQTCLTKSLIILADRLINTCLFIQYLLKKNKILHVINISCMSAVLLDTLSSCLNTKRPYEYLLMGLSRLILMDCRLSAVQTCRQSAESQQQRPSTISVDLVTSFLLPLDS